MVKGLRKRYPDLPGSAVGSASRGPYAVDILGQRPVRLRPSLDATTCPQGERRNRGEVCGYRTAAQVRRQPPPERAAELPNDEDPHVEMSVARWRSEEHTSELQSQSNLVCRLLLEKKK